VALLHAGFGLPSVLWGLHDLTPCALARLRTAASDKLRIIRIKKVFPFFSTLHFTLLKQAKIFGGMQNSLAVFGHLLQTVVAKNITQVVGGDNRPHTWVL